MLWIVVSTTVSGAKLPPTHVSMTPQRIPDGVLVTGGTETRARTASWTILVTLDVPRDQPRLSTAIARFRATLQQTNITAKFPRTALLLWERRIRELASTALINPKDAIKRSRRGLLNIVGSLANTLFGTATEAEVEVTRQKLKSVSKKNRRITHVVKELITVINQTHDELKALNLHVRSSEQYLSDMVKQVQIGQTRQNNELHTLQMTIKIDHSSCDRSSTRHVVASARSLS